MSQARNMTVMEVKMTHFTIMPVYSNHHGQFNPNTYSAQVRSNGNSRTSRTYIGVPPINTVIIPIHHIVVSRVGVVGATLQRPSSERSHGGRGGKCAIDAQWFLFFIFW